jgi:hypothetical protein
VAEIAEITAHRSGLLERRGRLERDLLRVTAQLVRDRSYGPASRELVASVLTQLDEIGAALAELEPAVGAHRAEQMAAHRAAMFRAARERREAAAREIRERMQLP